MLIPQITEFGSFRDLFIFFVPGHHVDYYPVRDLSYLLDHLLWPDSLTLARLHQLLLFWGVAFGVVQVLCRFGIPWGLSFVMGACWALHPVHAETIVWLSARKDVLSLLFGVWSVFWFIDGLQKRDSRSLGLAGFLFVLGLLSKASFGLLPFAALLALSLARVPMPQAARLCLIAGTGLGLASSFFQSWFYSQVNDMRLWVPFGLRLETAFAALGRMVAGYFVSWVNTVDGETFGDWLSLNQRYILLGALIFIAGIVSTLWGFFRKRPLLWVGGASFFALYLPISGLVFPHRSLYSTRYFEPAALVLLLMSALGIASYLCRNEKVLSRKSLQVSGIFVILFFGGWASLESSNWEDSVAIRKKAWRFQPESLSQMSFLWADLYNLQARGRAGTEDKALFNELSSTLQRRCDGSQLKDLGITSPEINCAIYLRHQMELARFAKTTSREDQLLEDFLRTQEPIHPKPPIIERLYFEADLRKGGLREDLREPWLTKPFYPNSVYKILHVTALCMAGRIAEARDRYQADLQENVLTPLSLPTYLSSLLGPSERAKMEMCLALADK